MFSRIKKNPIRLLAVIAPLVLAATLIAAPPASHADEWTVAPEAPMDGLHIAELFGGAYLGVRLEEETEYAEGGARITEVVEDSPAERAGLREGDIIVEIDGKVVRGPVALTKHIHTRETGDTVRLSLVRDGSRQSVEVELGDRKEVWSVPFAKLENLDIQVPELDPEVVERLTEQLESLELQELELQALEGLSWFGDCEDGDCPRVYAPMVWGGRPTLGVQLVETTPELRRHLGSADDSGVLVSKVLGGTPAEKGGILVGDLIVAVDGESVEDTSDLRRALRDKEGESFLVDVIRDEKPMAIEITIPEPEIERPSGPRAYRVRPAVPAAPAALAAPAVVPSPTRIRVVAPVVVPSPAPSAVPRSGLAAPAPPAPVAPVVAPAKRIVLV